MRYVAKHTRNTLSPLRRTLMSYDVVIVGGGPAGLSAALALGRARKQVLLCDSGPRRNAAAERVHNFVTRDGTPPDEFRSTARGQLTNYPKVEVRDTRVESISGSRGAFEIVTGEGIVKTRRVLLCTGMVDELIPLEGLSELWGHSIFQCPYCHGWENQDRPWGYLARAEHVSHLLPFVLQLRGWTHSVTVFTSGTFELPEDLQKTFDQAGVHVETGPLARLVAREGSLEFVELADGTRVPCESLFVHPPQRQVELVRALGIALDQDGFVQVDSMKRETSIPGIFASGDLTTRMQAAIAAAASGLQAASMINVDLSFELTRSP